VISAVDTKTLGSSAPLSFAKETDSIIKENKISGENISTVVLMKAIWDNKNLDP
jgi:hypothetical protein